jgi:hypothetical protein
MLPGPTCTLSEAGDVGVQPVHHHAAAEHGLGDGGDAHHRAAIQAKNIRIQGNTARIDDITIHV